MKEPGTFVGRTEAIRENYSLHASPVERYRKLIESIRGEPITPNLRMRVRMEIQKILEDMAEFREQVQIGVGTEITSINIIPLNDYTRALLSDLEKE